MPRNSPQHYQDQYVRDLAWSIGSPALLQLRDEQTDWKTSPWFTSLYQAYQPFLRQLDQQPDQLHRWLNDSKTRRLGSYFEKLWGFWLSTNGQYRLLKANLPVRDIHKTIGEFDFLVEDLATGEHQHWELAIKFYLGIGDLTHFNNWWGPMKQDRLDLKIAHMQNHQCRLSLHPQSQILLNEQGIDIQSCCAIVKGRLFYPLLNTRPASRFFSPDHLKGWWSTLDLFKEQTNPSQQYKILAKDQWLSETLAADNLLTHEDLLNHFSATGIQRPQAIAIVEGGQEISRGFITEDNWINSIENVPRS